MIEVVCTDDGEIKIIVKGKYNDIRMLDFAKELY